VALPPAAPPSATRIGSDRFAPSGCLSPAGRSRRLLPSLQRTPRPTAACSFEVATGAVCAGSGFG